MPYAMPSTDFAYGASRRERQSVCGTEVVAYGASLRECYAMRGTETANGGSRTGGGGAEDARREPRRAGMGSPYALLPSRMVMPSTSAL
eukprot:2637471-Rhodomonas_salina.3